MSQTKFKESIERLIENRHRIPDEFWVPTGQRRYSVIWFMSRQKPSIEESYSFTEERFGLTKDGKVIWGFDSGCSCPTPWGASDYDDGSYSVKEWKEFEVADYGKPETPQYGDWFDEGWKEESLTNLGDYLLLIEDDLDPARVLEAKNAEVRRYLIKRIGYEKIKDKVKAEVLHVDGDSELLRFASGEMYVKVKDSSTAREYLLYVEGRHETCRSAIAWTFGLREEEYKPIIET